MNVINSRFCLLALAGSAVLSPLPLDAREDSSPMDLARQLNQAFIEVADKVSNMVSFPAAARHIGILSTMLPVDYMWHFG